jgi:hypothetical protein
VGKGAKRRAHRIVIARSAKRDEAISIRKWLWREIASLRSQ